MNSEANTTCDGCGACCLSIGHPPFLLELNGGAPEPIGGEDSAADYHRLRTAPVAAQAAYLEHVGTINAPCSWLDSASRRCRYYDFRPDICRTFEIGGKWCSQHRELHHIA